MTVKDRKAVFNVGGGIVFDSRAEDEYEETLTKAKALLNSINGILE
jgi:para-aminobenzoate synthetase component 1